jgi:single-strand DNA-binding protein
MASLNQIFIAGNVGNEPEMRFTPSGVGITQINVAVNDPKLQADGTWKDNTQWFKVICFNKIAERVNEKVKKGDPVLCVGKLQVSRWDDKNTGEHRFGLEVVANKVVSFSKAVYKGSPEESPLPNEDDIIPDDMPF